MIWLWNGAGSFGDAAQNSPETALLIRTDLAGSNSHAAGNGCLVWHLNVCGRRSAGWTEAQSNDTFTVSRCGGPLRGILSVSVESLKTTPCHHSKAPLPSCPNARVASHFRGATQHQTIVVQQQHADSPKLQQPWYGVHACAGTSHWAACAETVGCWV